MFFALWMCCCALSVSAQHRRREKNRAARRLKVLRTLSGQSPEPSRAENLSARMCCSPRSSAFGPDVFRPIF